MLVVVTHSKGGVGGSVLTDLLANITGWPKLAMNYGPRGLRSEGEATAVYEEACARSENLLVDTMPVYDGLTRRLAGESNLLIHIGIMGGLPIRGQLSRARHQLYLDGSQPLHDGETGALTIPYDEALLGGAVPLSELKPETAQFFQRLASFVQAADQLP